MFIHKLSRMLLALALTVPMANMAVAFQDVLDAPARQSVLASKTLLNGLASAGQRVVAVGQRGHIVYSDDGGNSWLQAEVPVSSDLVAASFPTAERGWAVGHDGVVLHTRDAGATWTKQLDGRAVGKIMLAYYTAEAERGTLGSAEDAARLVEEAERFVAQGAENPFLDVWFADENNGFVIGAFNQILRTTDGGVTWEPWFHRTENPSSLHLYAIRGIASEVYIAGEQGLVLKLDAEKGRFSALETPYAGTYFGVTGDDNGVLVFGLRGHAFRSGDGGKSWSKVETGLQDGLTAAASIAGRMVLVSQSGNVLVSKDAGRTFSPVKLARAAPAAAVVALGEDVAVIAGPGGVRTQTLQ